MKKSLIALAALALCGCTSLNNAGHAAYSVTQRVDGKGCDFSASDGKEFAGRGMAFNGRDCTLMVQEGESNAFKGQALAVKALGLPTMGLADILAPRDK